MATTSLKLSDELKQRTIVLAQKQGVSPHAFMVDAIEHAATAAERRAGFVDQALAARAEMRKSDAGFDSGEVHTYLKARIKDTQASRPKAKSWQS